jgi:phosphatidylserine/phosphatidylglycerophosphate/cardiolipin synthase-like enzyme
MLKNHGVEVVENPKIHQKFAVIDGCIAWYGSINLLSYVRTEESIMRLESKGIAEELARVL